MTGPFQGPIEKRRKGGGKHGGGQDLGAGQSWRRVQGRVVGWLRVGCREEDREYRWEARVVGEDERSGKKGIANESTFQPFE